MKVPTSRIDIATQTKNGLMSKEDKKKLDNINQNSNYLPLSGGTLTGALTIKASSRSNNKINIGDGDYIHFAETDDDHLEIKASYIDFVLPRSDTTENMDRITLKGETFPYCRMVYLGQNPNINNVKCSGVYGIYQCSQAPSLDIGVLEVLEYSVDWVLQRYTNIGNGHMWERRFYSGTTWSGWTQRW